MNDPEWFVRLTGFEETDYADTRARLRMDGTVLYSSAGKRIGDVGSFQMASLSEMRRELGETGPSGNISLTEIHGESGRLHRDASNAGATMQVASQFNCLEMVGPEIKPEDGVTDYAFDSTQGPACAIAAGAATIWRNYLVPIGNQRGQTSRLQLDGASGIAASIQAALGDKGVAPWEMRNGYLLPDERGLQKIAGLLGSMPEAARDKLRGELRVGLQVGAEVDCPGGHRLTQVFCSAVPVSYSGLDPAIWEPLARLVLEACYEATLIAAALNARQSGNRACFLTKIGGGAFGNRLRWVEDAIHRAASRCRGLDLDVRLVHFG